MGAEFEDSSSVMLVDDEASCVLAGLDCFGEDWLSTLEIGDELFCEEKKLDVETELCKELDCLDKDWLFMLDIDDELLSLDEFV